MKPPNKTEGFEVWLDDMKARESLTQAVQEQICKAIRMGAHDRFAARYAGVPPRWFRRWMKAGKYAHARAPYDNDYQRYCAALYIAVEKARGEYAYNTLLKIERAGGLHWQALAWKLRQFLTGYCFSDSPKKPRKKDSKDKNNQKKQTAGAVP